MTARYATKADIPASYRRDYERGWRASVNPTDVGGLSPLERADARDETDAWYDGYMDYACDRPKWATPLGHGPES